MTQPAQSPIAQLERAWHRLMHAMAVRQPDRVNAGQIVLRTLHGEMKRR